MKKNLSVAFSSLFLIFILSCTAAPAIAQCAMCKSSVESTQNADTRMEKFGKGLNKGILYIMAAPYILAGTVGFFWYRNTRKTIK
jgi:hypothetical protein